jgi:glycerol-3-phosphate O-acyltransferase / dihydroxyacetone phosphate acyltransferase
MLLRLFYIFCQGLIRSTFWIMYECIEVRNGKKLKFTAPCIVVSNHPSTLMDPLMVAGYRMNQHLKFLANVSLFKHWLGNWFFTTFYCIKIERPQDTSGRPINNAEAFKMAIDHITRKGSLYVAVEGSSYMERRLRDVKTGAARIALFAEAANDFQLGTNILPVGLDYDAPHRFRSCVAINVGEPIAVSDFKALYLSDPNAAVVALTDAIEKALKTLIVHVEDAEQELLLRQIETIQQHDNQVSPIENIDCLKIFLIKIKKLKEKQSTEYQRVVSDFKNYFNELKAENIRDNVISKPVFSILKIIFLILAFPIFVIGIANHALLLLVVYFLHRKLKDLYIGYYTSMYFLTGIVILLPMIYPLQNALLSTFSSIHISNWLYMPIMLLCGVIAWYWYIFAKDIWGRLTLSSSKYANLKSKRKELQLTMNN